jgi:acyl carrier protein
VIVAPYEVLADVRKRETEKPSVVGETTVAEPEKWGSAELQSRPELSTAYDAPQSDVERRLASIWGELLGIDRIGRHDDFFELGGHSLLATRVLARVQDSLGTRLTLREVFDSPTVQKMASRLESVAPTAGSEDEREEMEF